MKKKEYRRELKIALIILAISLFANVVGWYFGRQLYLSDSKTEQKKVLLELAISDYQQYQYYSQFRATLDVLQLDYEIKVYKNSKEINDENDGISSLYERMSIQDTLSKKYPIVYNKSLESDKIGSKTLSTLQMICLVYENEEIHQKIDELIAIIPASKILVKFLEDKLKDKPKILSSTLLDDFLINHHEMLLLQFNELFTLMLEEIENE
ncbi:hypothetical protein [Winogradskyella sp.]|uniref:hypothetical protein n=1 Tax=Winogradskyella sp. TaxID=1883156 RepID=UPI003BAB6953